MATFQPILDSFLIYDPERDRSACSVAIPLVPEADRERLGRLFLVSEIHPDRPGHAERLRALQDIITNAYYSTQDRGVESSFEQALSVANSWIQEQLRRDDEPWSSGFACFVGAIRDSFITFTRVGDIQGLLMRGLRVASMAPSTAGETINPLKVFSTTWNGTLLPTDTLLVATSSLLDYFSQEKLRRTLNRVTPAEAAAEIEAALRDNPTHTAFAALILQLQPAGAGSAPDRIERVLRPSALTTQASVEALNAKARSTHELLRPSLWRSIVLLVRDGAARSEDVIRTTLLRKPPRRRYVPTRERGERPGSLIVSTLVALGSLLKRGLLLLLSFFIAGFGALIRLSRGRHGALPAARPPVRQSFAIAARGIKRLPRRQQIALAAIVVAVVGLIVGGVVAGGRGTRRPSVDKTALATHIKDKATQLETVLSYGDEAGAQALLKEIDELIATHPAKRQGDRAAVDGFRSTLAPLRDRVNLVIHPTFTTHADLSGQGRGALVALTRLNRTLYAVSDAGSVLDVTTEGKPELFEPPAQPLIVQDAIPDTNTLLLWSEDSLTRFTPRDASYAAVEITLPVEPRVLATFQQRLYVIDRPTDQIIRYTRAGAGYGTGTPWLKDRTVRVGDATGLVIDGSVYVAADGTIHEFIQGAPQALTLQTVEPTLSGMTELWTDETTTRLYALSPSTGRLVVFTERGSLVAQYADDRLRDARSVVIDERAKLAYILTSTTVERFPLE